MPRGRYLVTGATGFLGAHLVDALLAAGNDVVAFSRGGSDGSANAARGDAVRGRRTDVAGDVLDEPSLVDAMRTCDGVFHLAGFVSPRSGGR